MELPEDEKSKLWKFALLSYSVAAPLVLASPIMFMIYRQNMFEGEVCKFYELADSENHDQQECLANYESDPEKYIDASGFRYTAFLMSLILPACFLMIELFQN